MSDPAEVARAAARELLMAKELFPPDLVRLLGRTVQLVRKIFVVASAMTASGPSAASKSSGGAPSLPSELAGQVLELASPSIALPAEDLPRGRSRSTALTTGALGSAVRVLEAARGVLRARVESSRELSRLLRPGNSEADFPLRDRNRETSIRLATMTLLLADGVEPDEARSLSVLLSALDPSFRAEEDSEERAAVADWIARASARAVQGERPARATPSFARLDGRTLRVTDTSRELLEAVERFDALQTGSGAKSSDEQEAGRIRCASAGLALASRSIEWIATLRGLTTSGPDAHSPVVPSVAAAPEESGGRRVPPRLRRDGVPIAAPAPARRRPESRPEAPEPPRRIADLGVPGVRREEAVRLATARLVFADYAALQRDFPTLEAVARSAGEADLGAMAPTGRTEAATAGIDRWLLDNAALVSVSQARQTRVNTPIETTGDAIEVFRPPRYGRALVVPIRQPLATRPFDGSAGGDRGAGLLDIKGAGVSPDQTPRADRYHTNGLLPLGLAFYEYLMKGLLEAVFRHAGTQFSTLPIYAVIDLGFDGMGPGSPPQFLAGLLVRRAHRRPRGGQDLYRRGSVGHQAQLEIEMLVRQYGISSCRGGMILCGNGDSRSFARDRFSPYAQTTFSPSHPLWSSTGYPEAEEGGRLRVKLVNVQLTAHEDLAPSRAEVFDFESFEVEDRFRHPVLSQVNDRPLRWGGLFSSRDDHFIQPRPDLAVPYEAWEVQQLLVWTARLAHRFRSGELTGSEVRRELDGLLAATTSRWRQ